MSGDGESGLSRWARRKAAARATGAEVASKRGAALPEVEAPEPEATPAQPVETPGPETPPPAEDLPDIETLDYESDYSAFLSPDVEESVRNMALRRLWRSNPVLANVDGLVDYDDDFTDAATVIEGMKSIYKVGRGMLEDEAETVETSADAPQADRETADAEDAAQTDSTSGEEASDPSANPPPTAQSEETETEDGTSPDVATRHS